MSENQKMNETKTPKVGETVYLITNYAREKLLTECECVAVNSLYIDLKNKETNKVISFWFCNKKEPSNYIKRVYDVPNGSLSYCFCTEENCPNHIKSILINYKTQKYAEKDRLEKEYSDVKSKISQVDQLLQNIDRNNFEHHNMKQGDTICLIRSRGSYRYLAKVIEINKNDCILKVFDYNGEPSKHMKFYWDDKNGGLKTTVWSNNCYSFVNDYFYYKKINN